MCCLSSVLIIGCGSGSCNSSVEASVAPFIVTYANMNYAVDYLTNSATRSYAFTGAGYKAIQALDNMILNFARVDNKPLYVAQYYPEFLRLNPSTPQVLLSSSDGYTWSSVASPCANGEIALYEILNANKTLYYLRCQDINTGNTMSLWSTADGANFMNVNNTPQTDAGSRYLNLNNNLIRISVDGKVADSLQVNGTWVALAGWTNPNGITADNMVSNNTNIIGSDGANGVVYLSSDSGASWTQSATLANVYVLYNQGSNEFMAYNTDNPSIIKTSSDGSNWSVDLALKINNVSSQSYVIPLITYNTNYGYMLLDPSLSPSLVNTGSGVLPNFTTFSFQPPTDSYTDFEGVKFGMVTSSY